MSEGEGNKQISADGQLSEGNLYDGSNQDFAAEWGITPTGWAEATAKDYWADQARRHAKRGDTSRARSWQSRQASWRANNRWQTTVRRWSTDLSRKQSSPSAPFSKGESEGITGFWSWVVSWLPGGSNARYWARF